MKLFTNNYKDIPEIIIPTLFVGGTEPKEAKKGDIWVKDMGEKYEFHVYLDRWFTTKITKETEYTEEQKLIIKKYDEKEKTEQEKEIEKYRNFRETLKEILEGTENEI